MFVDASVIVAILGREPGWQEIVKRLEGERQSFSISPLVRFEAVVALARKKTAQGAKPSPALLSLASAAVDEFVAGLGADEIAITAEIGSIALGANREYGKTVGHPAALNFGDCFAYACAKFLGTGLAYKGDDFLHTDLA